MLSRWEGGQPAGQCLPLFFSHLGDIFSFGKDCSYRRKAFGMSRMKCSEEKERMFSDHTLKSLCGEERGCQHSSNLPTRPSAFQNRSAIFSRLEALLDGCKYFLGYSVIRCLGLLSR